MSDAPGSDSASVAAEAALLSTDADELREEAQEVASANPATVRADALRATRAADASAIEAEARRLAETYAAERMNSINRVWELVQASISVALVGAVIALSLWEREVPDVLTGAMYSVLGFYFGRTNHSRPTPTRPMGEA